MSKVQVILLLTAALLIAADSFQMGQLVFDREVDESAYKCFKSHHLQIATKMFMNVYSDDLNPQFVAKSKAAMAAGYKQVSPIWTIQAYRPNNSPPSLPLGRIMKVLAANRISIDRLWIRVNSDSFKGSVQQNKQYILDLVESAKQYNISLGMSTDVIDWTETTGNWAAPELAKMPLFFTSFPRKFQPFGPWNAPAARWKLGWKYFCNHNTTTIDILKP
jgi:hypothetical protein